MKIKKIFAIGVVMSLLASNYYSTSSHGEDTILMKGNDITKTSCELSEKTYNQSNSVILSGKGATVDLLSSAPLSGLLKAPILINSGKNIDNRIIMEMDRLNVENVYIISGAKVISKEIVDNLKKQGYKIVDLSGKDRYQTSDNIADYIINKKKDFEKSILINGVNYADSPSISAFAYKHVTPILLTNGKSLTKETYKIVNINNNLLMVGGDKSISDSLYNELQNKYIKMGRIIGENRYDTSKKIVEGLFEYNNKLLLADGKDDIDAGIIASGYCAKNNRPLLLVKKRYKYKDMIQNTDNLYVSEKAYNDINQK